MRSLAWVGMLGSIAHAQPADPAVTPGFVTIDRFDASTRAGVEASYLFFHVLEPPPGFADHFTSLRFDLYGHGVDPETGLGAYVQMPASHTAHKFGAEDTWALGDLDIGALYVVRGDLPALAIVVHAGLSLPTGARATDRFESNVYAGLARMNDFVLEIPRGVTIRIGASPLARFGPWFARGDADLDIKLSQDRGDLADNVLRLNLAAGVDVGLVAVSLESSNVFVSSPNGG